MNEFDKKAATWDEPKRAERAKVIARAISDLLPKDTTLTALEYGCGTGLVGLELRDRFKELTLVDSSKGMLEVVREKLKDLSVKNIDVLDADSLAGTSKKFDVIFSSMVLHHIPDTKKILSDWHGLMSAHGNLCIVDLDPDGGLFHDDGFDGHSGFDRGALGEQARVAGFTNIKFSTICDMQKIARDGVERTFTLFLMIAEKK